MNEAIQTELKIIVERAVRPVRASTSHKRKMREELLAHVSGVLEAEVAKLGDDRIALGRTALRFGNPSELTSQLQETVPASDRITQFWEGEPGETVLRSALRVAWVTAAIVLVVGCPAVLLTTGMSESLREEIIIFVSGLAFLPVWLCGIAFVTHWMEKSLHGPEPLIGWPRISLAKSVTSAWAVPPVRAALIAGCSCLFLMLGLHGATWPTDPEGWDPWILVLGGVLLAGDLAATSVLTAWALVQSADARRRYHEEWANLNID